MALAHCIRPARESLTLVSSPPTSGGRPPIFGTILQADDGEQFVVARLVYSLAYNAGNSGSPRVEVWIALARSTMAPFVVRRDNRAWRTCADADFGIRRDELIDSLRLTGYAIQDWLEPRFTWPTMIWDRRVILPDDERWPKSKKHVVPTIESLLRRRNACPNDQVWAIDAMILNLAARQKE